CVVFFFQAEDGIRDFHVTGVQTCALPISQRVDVTFRWIEKDMEGRVLVDEAATYGVRYTFPIELEHLLARAGFEAIDVRGGYDEIGRASCRERVSGAGGAGAVNSEEPGWH